MASLGRALQILGLVLPPLSIVLQLQAAITAGQMLLLLVAAVSAFWIGRIVEGYARHEATTEPTQKTNKPTQKANDPTQATNEPTQPARIPSTDSTHQ